MAAVTVSDLKGGQLFSYLPTRDLVQLSRIASQQIYRKGEMIFLEGAEADAFWVVLKGQVKIFKLGAEGREQILRIARAGESFAEAAALSRGAFPANAEAIARSVVIRFPSGKFLGLLKSSPQLAINVIVGLSHLLRGFAGLVDALALRDVSARLAKYLLDRLVRSEGEWIALDVRKSVLAARLGTVSETLSRTLRRLSDKGLIQVDGQRIRILDRPGLDRAAAGIKV
ncbi:MAG: Crp/Fnr family transcriptional regulator [Armatimonadota bacterium]|nr:MAG: Crp/Fnr family transcriptional regulator [Armatimonadota bacterium]